MSTKHGNTKFENLKIFLKEESNLTKAIFDIIKKRVDIELSYCKKLTVLSSKLLEVVKDKDESVLQAWHCIAIDFQQTSEIHEMLATSLSEKIVKPLEVCEKIILKFFIYSYLGVWK